MMICLELGDIVIYPTIIVWELFSTIYHISILNYLSCVCIYLSIYPSIHQIKEALLDDIICAHYTGHHLASSQRKVVAYIVLQFSDIVGH